MCHLSCTSSFFFCQSNNTCKSRLWHLLLKLSSQVSAVCFAHRRCWICLVQVSSPCGLRRQYSERKVHTAFLHCAPQRLRDVAVTGRQKRLSQVTSPSSSTHSMNRRDVLMRSGQATPTSWGGNVSRRTMSNSLPAFPSVPSDQFYDTEKITTPTDYAHGSC